MDALKSYYFMSQPQPQHQTHHHSQDKALVGTENSKRLLIVIVGPLFFGKFCPSNFQTSLYESDAYFRP